MHKKRSLSPKTLFAFLVLFLGLNTTFANIELYPILKNETELPPFKKELLSQAMDTASAVPLEPHHKTRALRQEEVLFEYIDEKQYQTAFDQADNVENWRRGSIYAELAYHLALQGDAQNAHLLFKMAGKESANAEGWRHDRIVMRVAQGHAILGEMEAATAFETEELDPSEQGRLTEIKSAKQTNETINAHLMELDLIADNTPLMDVKQNTVTAYFVVYDDFYDNIAVRTHAQEKIIEHSATLPVYEFFYKIIQLADVAIKHGDLNNAKKILEEAEYALRPSNGWELHHRLELSGVLAGTLYQAGEEEKATALINESVQRFHDEGEEIFNFWRGIALRPIAEAYVKMGNLEKATEIYQLALDQGSINPNARPRANDLVATLLSMEKAGFEPNENMRAQIREIHTGLKAPW